MANNFLEGTGVLIFDGEAKVTPVIKALFGHFDLENAEAGGGVSQLYIAHNEGASADWDSLYESLIEALDKEEGAEEYGSLADALRRVAAQHDGDLAASLIAEAERLDKTDGGDYAGIDEVFDLALRINDGHNLSGMDFEAAYFCSKPRLFEFGGYGAFESRAASVVINSGAARNVGEAIDKAVASEEGIAELAAQVDRLVLSGIRDEERRSALRQRLAARLATTEEATAG